MWLHSHCPACGAGNWSPASPAHPERCVECDAPLGDHGDDLAPLAAAIQAKAARQSGKGWQDLLLIGGLLAFLGLVVAGGYVAPWGHDEFPRDRLPAKLAEAPTPDEPRERAPEPPANAEPMKPGPPKGPTDGSVWATHTDDKAGFRVAFPVWPDGPTTAATKIHLAVPHGTVLEVQHESYAGDRTEEELLQWSGVNYRSRLALTRADFTLGGHPGVEFTAAATLTGQKKTVRSRVVAAGRKIYQVSVVTDPGEKCPPTVADQFLNSFRLLSAPGAEVVHDPLPVWRESWSIAGNFSVALPGRATELRAGPEAVSRAVDELGTEYSVRSIAYPSPPRTERDLLEEVGVRELAKNARAMREIKHGTHPGIEFGAAVTPDGRAKMVRSRVFAVGDRIIQLSIVADPMTDLPWSTVSQLYNSFQLVTDPAVPAGGLLTDRPGGRTLYASRDWNFAAEWPSVPTAAPPPTPDESAAWAVTATDPATKARFAVTVFRPRGDAVGKALLDGPAARRRFGNTETAPITLGAHPGVAFTAAEISGAEKRTAHTRLYAVQGWLYEVTISAPAGVTVPADTAARFFESFRLLDPAGRRKPG